MSAPRVVLTEDLCYQRRYRIEGGTLEPTWAASLRRGEAAYCHVTVWTGNDQLGSYGGSVWPTAWPELFEAIPASASGGCGGVRILPAGLAALAAAARQ